MLMRNSPNNRWAIKIFMLAALLILTNLSCGLIIPISPFADNFENISLEEAQQLTPFTICLPTYLPEELGTDPQIIYHADFGDPQEAEIRLQYFQISEEELMLEIKQTHIPGAVGFEPDRSENSREAAILNLSGWISNWQSVDLSLKAQVTNFDEGTIYWLFETTEPPQVHANMVDWLENSVYYQVFSRLSAEEVKKFSLSVSCQ